ncbi:MAG: transposase [Acidimicrobiales bacterium]
MPIPLVPGTHYPRHYDDFLAWFATDAACADYLEWLRWPRGFECVECQGVSACRLADGRLKCLDCKGRTSVTAGTIFDRTRTPLPVWFHVAWNFATHKDGISALALKNDLGMSSYQTAWAMLHRLRSVTVRPGRDQLKGAVEVDETFPGSGPCLLPPARAGGCIGPQALPPGHPDHEGGEPGHAAASGHEGHTPALGEATRGTSLA